LSCAGGETSLCASSLQGLGSRIGAKRVLVSGLPLQAFGALAYFFVCDLGAFYVVAAVFGFIYAGVMPLYAVLARENFPLRMMGTVIGGTAMAGSLGMAIGRRLDLRHLRRVRLALHRRLGIGIGAFLVAMTFRPFAREQPAPA
jgi:MFS family permease